MKSRTIFGGAEGLIDFLHSQLAKVVYERYLAKEDSRKARHQQLANYFRNKADPEGKSTWANNNPRNFGGLSYQLYNFAELSGEYQRFFALINDKLFKNAGLSFSGLRNRLKILNMR